VGPDVSNPMDRIPLLVAVGGLIRRRKEIAAAIDRKQYEIRKLVTDLDAVDAAIRRFDPDAPLTHMVRPSRSFCGQQRLILLTLLQESAGPLTTRQLALGLMLHRGLPTTDLKLVRQMIQRCHLTLHAMKRQKEVERLKDGDLFRWRPITNNAGDAA
jgi:hypothetical protein